MAKKRLKSISGSRSFNGRGWWNTVKVIYFIGLLEIWAASFKAPASEGFAAAIVLSVPVFIRLIVVIVRKVVGSKQKQGYPASVNIDNLTGLQFENFCASLLQRNGYVNVRVTQASGDFGADIVSFDRNGNKWVFQCKRYQSNLGNTPIQEVVAAKLHYGARYAGVMTNSHFSTAARQLARENGVALIEREQLFSMNRVSTPPVKKVKKSAPAPEPVVKKAQKAAVEERQVNWIDEIETIDAALDDD